MLTQLGIFLRKLRLDSGEIMKEMATRLDVSSSFLSAVENGKKKMPDSWYEMIIDQYNLDKEKQDELMTAIEESQKSLEINLEDLSKEKKRLAFSFARELENMNKEEVDKMKIFFNKEGDWYRWIYSRSFI